MLNVIFSMVNDEFGGVELNREIKDNIEDFDSFLCPLKYGYLGGCTTITLPHRHQETRRE